MVPTIVIVIVIVYFSNIVVIIIVVVVGKEAVNIAHDESDNDNGKIMTVTVLLCNNARIQYERYGKERWNKYRSRIEASDTTTLLPYGRRKTLSHWILPGMPWKVDVCTTEKRAVFVDNRRIQSNQRKVPIRHITNVVCFSRGMWYLGRMSRRTIVQLSVLLVVQ